MSMRCAFFVFAIRSTAFFLFCHPERSVRLVFLDCLFLRVRWTRQSKDLYPQSRYRLKKDLGVRPAVLFRRRQALLPHGSPMAFDRILDQPDHFRQAAHRHRR